MLKIQIIKGNIEAALKQYKNKVRKTKQQYEIERKRYFDKPSELNRESKKLAIYKESKKNNDND
jgi:small subunit ribosomal protein S21